MLRRLFAIISALSLAACAAICALIAVSYQRPIDIELVHKGTCWLAVVSRSLLTLDNDPQYQIDFRWGQDHFKLLYALSERDNQRDAEVETELMNHPDPARIPALEAEDRRLSKILVDEERSMMADLRLPPSVCHSIRLATVAAIFAVLPTVTLVINCFFRMRRRTWSNAGACATCGYDLRGTPDRCPECGSSPPRK